MAYGSIHASCAVFSKGFRTFAEGAGGIYDVVYDEAVSVFYIADDIHDFGHARFRTAFFNDGNGRTHSVGQFAGTGDTAKVRRNDGEVFQVLGFHIVRQKGCRHEVIHRYVEEALNLACMEVHGHHAGDAGSGHEVCHQLGADWFTASGLSVLTGIAVVRNHHRNVTGRSSLQCVHHDKHFHEVIVHRCSGRLDDEAVLAADTFINHDLNFAIVETSADSLSQRHADVVGNLLGQCRVCCSCKNLQFRSVFHVHFAASPFPSNVKV